MGTRTLARLARIFILEGLLPLDRACLVGLAAWVRGRAAKLPNDPGSGEGTGPWIRWAGTGSGERRTLLLHVSGIWFRKCCYRGNVNPSRFAGASRIYFDRSSDFRRSMLSVKPPHLLLPPSLSDELRQPSAYVLVLSCARSKATSELCTSQRLARTQPSGPESDPPDSSSSGGGFGPRRFPFARARS